MQKPNSNTIVPVKNIVINNLKITLNEPPKP